MLTNPCSAARIRSPSTAGIVASLLSLAAALGLSIAEEASAAGGTFTTTFADVTFDAGLSATHEAVDAYYITGQAWGDVDGDGCFDLYVTSSDGPNVSYRNRCDGTFEVAPWDLDAALPSRMSGGAAFADYDGDGDLDLAVANFGANALLRNDAGTLVDVSASAGVGHLGQGESVAWGDFDRDGVLDLFITNWYYEEEIDSPLNHDVLLRGRGDGTFEDLSSMLDPAVAMRPGFAVGFLDFDFDGDLDIYVVNDKNQGNALWRNDGEGCGGWCFVDVAPAVGAVRPVSGMGLAVGDVDNDGDLDMAFSGVSEVVLLQNLLSQGETRFEEITIASGMAVPAGIIAWATIFLDVDNDRRLDVYFATDNVDAPRSDRLFMNDGVIDGLVRFTDRSAESGLGDAWGSMGAASADYDDDGRIDLVIGNPAAPYRLFRNVDAAAAENGFLRVEVEGRPPLDTRALGTRVELVDSDGVRQIRTCTSGDSFGAGSAPSLHFGLGDATPVALTIRWPDGLVEERPVPAGAERLTIVYPRVFADDFEEGGTDAWSSAPP